MVRISAVLLFLGLVAMSGIARAQCQAGGGGGGTTTTTSTGTSGGTTTSATLLTGPGSYMYDLMMAQAIQSQMAQRNAMLAAQKQAQRQEDLAKRKYWAAHKRLEIADRRLRMRAFLAQQ